MLRLLFSTVYDPAPLMDRWSATDQMAYRLTRGQGIFTLREHAHAWPLHLLAQNVACESVVLEWPSLEEFEQECAADDYDFVCITFMNRDLTKLGAMTEVVRRRLPRAKIVVGGYGVICVPDHRAPREHVDYDHICRGEGVHFLRELAGEDTTRPVSCLLPQSGAVLPWLSRRNRGTVGALLAGLGCIQRCPFCVTSFYTRGRFLGVLDERELYEGMRRYWQVNPFTSTVNIYDENFLDYKERVDQLGGYLREDREYGLRRLNYFTFGSISALAKYDPVELLRNGLDTVWIGVESRYSRLKKLRGAEPEDVFATLHGLGIKTVGSFILGLDIQNQETVLADEDFFVGLDPTYQQISILTVEPNMPLARVYQNQRQKRTYPWENYHLYGQTYEPKNFTFDELLNRVDALYRRLYEENGPSIMRMLRVNLNGFQFCRGSSDQLLRDQKADFFARRVRSYAPLLPACIEFAPSERVRTLLRDIQCELEETFGAPDDGQRMFSEHVLRKAASEYALRGTGDPPLHLEEFKRYVYPVAARRAAVVKPYTTSYPRRLPPRTASPTRACESGETTAAPPALRPGVLEIGA